MQMSLLALKWNTAMDHLLNGLNWIAHQLAT